jgi:hypothetical protein
MSGSGPLTDYMIITFVVMVRRFALVEEHMAQNFFKLFLNFSWKRLGSHHKNAYLYYKQLGNGP